MTDRVVPEATVARLPLYLRSLMELADARTATVSSETLASMAGVNAAKVRKDLSYLGSYGTRGVGYDVEFLVFQMSNQLGLNRERAVVIAGAGNLGQALAKYRGFSDRGFPVVALVEADPTRVGTTVSGVPVVGTDRLGAVVAEHPGCIGVVATPAEVAQDVADQFVAHGVRSILNFAGTALAVPADVTARRVDLALELQILSFYAGRDDVARAAV